MSTIQNKLIERLNQEVKQGKTTLRAAEKATETSRTAFYYYRTGKRIMNVEQYTKLQEYLNNLNK